MRALVLLHILYIPDVSQNLPRGILADPEYRTWQRAQAGELLCPQCVHVPLAGKIVFGEVQDGQIASVLLSCPRCGFREY